MLSAKDKKILKNYYRLIRCNAPLCESSEEYAFIKGMLLGIESVAEIVGTIGEGKMVFPIVGRLGEDDNAELTQTTMSFIREFSVAKTSFSLNNLEFVYKNLLNPSSDSVMSSILGEG